MVFKTGRQLSPIVILGYAFTIGLALSVFAQLTHAQSTNVELSQPGELVNEAGDEPQDVNKIAARLFFAFGSETLELDSQSALRSFAEQAEANPDSAILIFAHTDDRGWSLGNLELSRIRAKTVAKELVASGIDITRMKALAFGESRPLASNDTADGRRLNRRVEISLTP